MSHSLGEIEALSKRAARGAGMSWGMAEEAGKAVRWLASHDLGAVSALADLLQLNDGKQAQAAPVDLGEVWRANVGVLCPIAAGTALNDCAARLTEGAQVQMENVSHPALIVAFAGWAALDIDAPVEVTWLDVSITTDGDKIWITDPKAQIAEGAPVEVKCRRVEAPETTGQAPAFRHAVDPAAWQVLNDFATRTYAPATEESRLLGAGAGVSDND